MHPKALLDECTALMEAVFRFDHPADAVVARYFREHKSLGPRERATLSDTVFAALRERLKFEWLARSGSGSKWRRLAILGFPGDRDFLKSALSEPEKVWLDATAKVREDEWLAPHRHNLPDWLADALRAQVGDQFDALAASLLQPAPLDLRVNALKTKREAALAALKAAGVTAEPTFLSISCRLDELDVEIVALGSVTPRTPKLRDRLGQATDLATDANVSCAAGDRKTARKALKGAFNKLGRLRKLVKASKTIPTQAELLATAGALRVDVRALRATLACPVPATLEP